MHPARDPILPRLWHRVNLFVATAQSSPWRKLMVAAQGLTLELERKDLRVWLMNS